MKRIGACLMLLGATLLAEEKPVPAGILEGTVTWEGEIPALQPLEVDPAIPKGCACAPNSPDGKKHLKPNEALLVDLEGKGVANCVVWLKGVKGGPAALGPAEITQKDCVFSPHVALVRAGQGVKVLNPEGIDHNFHTKGSENPEMNVNIPKFKKVVEVSFGKPEFVRVICDIHSGWMSCWIAVMENGWAAKTDAKGAFRIEGVPPGKYVLALWHEPVEKGGKPLMREQEVVVETGKSMEAGFRLKAD